MKHKLLLVGDSIRQSYQPYVAAGLAGKCDIAGVDVDINCRDTRTTLELFNDAIANSGATIIHWNNGLHDSKITEENDRQFAVPINEYRANLKELIIYFGRMNPARIIWARTTPVIEPKHNKQKVFIRRNESIDLYNKTADEVMKQNGIIINDLHSIIAANPNSYICEDGVHLTDDGKVLAAKSVIDVVLSYLTEESN